MKNYNQLKEYQKEHGNVEVPMNYGDDKLGKHPFWVEMPLIHSASDLIPLVPLYIATCRPMDQNASHTLPERQGREGTSSKHRAHPFARAAWDNMGREEEGYPVGSTVPVTC